MLRHTAACVVVLTVTLTALPARGLAQSGQNAALVGTVRDATGAVLPGATVTISSSALLRGSKSTQTDAAGEYRLAVLPPGVYDIITTLAGFTSVRREGIKLPPGATITIDVELPVASLTDVVTVRGQAPMIDVKSSSSPARIDQDLLHHLPTSRNVADLINLAPGIAADVSFGGSQKSNALYVEGLSTTEPLHQDPLTRFNYNWVEEVQIVALGANAEYGGFTGVAANSILRSGSNRFSGLGELWTTRPNWVGRNTASLSQQLREDFAPRQVLSWWDTSAQLGGPLARDRVWFFSGLQHAKHEDRPSGFVGSGARDERNLQVLLKLTAAITPNVRIEGFSEKGRAKVDGEYIDRYTPIEASNVVNMPQTNWNVRLTWVIGSHTAVEARHSGYVFRDAEEPRPPATRSGPAPHWDTLTQQLSGNAWYYFRQKSSEQATSVVVTHRADRVLGRSHELKAGLEFETTEARQEEGYPGGRIYWDFDGQPDSVDFWAGHAGNSATRRGVLFAQDSWSVSDRLTLMPGVRIELNRGSVPYKGTIFSTSPVSPRIGLAWDLTDDHKTVLRAHYGRYHDALFASRIMFGDTSEASAYISAIVVGPDEFLELYRDEPKDNYAIDTNLRHSFVDQFVVGLERELFSDFSLQAQYIRRKFDTFMGITDTGSVYVPVERRDPGPDNRAGTADDGSLITVYDLTNPGNKFLFLTNPKEAFNRYHAAQVVARKRYSRNWQVQASYTWSRNEGTVGNRWHVNAARFDLGSPGRFVNPNSFINAFGRATFDPTHEVKLLGTYRVPFWGGVNVSTVYRYTTGQAWGRRALIRNLRQGFEWVRIEPQGTRRQPAINRVDLRVEKTFKVSGPRQTLGLFLDAFNLSNQGVPNSDLTWATNDYSGSSFGQPSAWVDPRLLRAGVRFSF